MSSFQDIRFESPGYPIYRAFIMPCRQNLKLCDTIEVGAKEVDCWREMLEKLKTFLINAMESLSEGDRKLEDYEKLELISDLISLFLRIPLNREVLPSIAPSPLKIYMLMRLMGPELFREWERLGFDPLEFTYTFYNDHVRRYLREDKQYPRLSRMLSELETTGISNLLESCWLLIPADTRPVFNTASLISHLLLTSAIAWSMAINDRIKDRRTLARLRLAAILHDIGKPFKYRDHLKVSIDVAERMLGEILPKEDIEHIKELIEEHHDPKTRLGEIIGRADKFASAIDRLKRFLEIDPFKNIIKNRLEEAARALNYDRLDFEKWDFWCRIYEEYDRDLIKKLSEEFVRNIRKITKNFTTMPPKVKEDKEEYVSLRVVLIDVGGIQSFIYRSHSLRHIVAASLAIDSLVMAYIVAYLQWATSANYWLPYENFLYAAGGNVEMLIPYAILEAIKHEISRLGRSLALKYGIPLRIADEDLHEDYARTIRELMAKMSINKMKVASERYSASIPKSAEKGVKNICQLCFMEPPTTKVPMPEGEIDACEVCSKLHEIGFNIHFKEKYNSQIEVCGTAYLPREVFEMPWDEEGAQVRASERIMEIIAGHDRKELQELGKLARIRNISVIKVDGTLIGPLMTTCLSIADAYERSARIDLALKKSIEVAISEIYNGVLKSFDKMDAARAALSIKIGVLYAGGDDAVIFAPSWASPLIALILGREFLYNLGYVRGLSIGVAAASPKADIWALIDASSGLMHEAKKKARENIEEEPAKSTICFDIIEAGSISSNTINERLETLKHEKLTLQPFDVNDFEEMLRKILSLEEPKYNEIAYLSYLASRNFEILKKYSEGNIRDDLIGQISKIQHELKDIRRVIGEVLQAAKSMIIRVERIKQYEDYVFPIAYIYACRQITRVEETQAYKIIKSFILDNLGSSSSLSDVDRLIKIIGGGVI